MTTRCEWNEICDRRGLRKDRDADTPIWAALSIGALVSGLLYVLAFDAGLAPTKDKWHGNAGSAPSTQVNPR